MPTNYRFTGTFDATGTVTPAVVDEDWDGSDLTVLTLETDPYTYSAISISFVGTTPEDKKNEIIDAIRDKLSDGVKGEYNVATLANGRCTALEIDDTTDLEADLDTIISKLESGSLLSLGITFNVAEVVGEVDEFTSLQNFQFQW